jgi:outer membrane murein-binding lipoprotein Lpp
MISLLGLKGIYEEGVFRKKVYKEMTFEITGIKKKFLLGSVITAAYYIRGLGAEQKIGRYEWEPQEEGVSVEQLYEKLKHMIESAKKTKVEDLIAHAYACHEAEDVWIATCYAMGPRRMSERPYALWGDVGMVVV